MVLLHFLDNDDRPDPLADETEMLYDDHADDGEDEISKVD
ncbi:unnamed protein product [uncultured virus]|nr:unnamed protein product [uncultured virus]